MSDVVVHRPVAVSSAATRFCRFVALIARALDRTLFAHRIRRDLNELPDRLRRDIGLIRMTLAVAIVVPALVCFGA